jgi:hypothetical protein
VEKHHDLFHDLFHDNYMAYSMLFPSINHHGFWTLPPSKGLWGIRDHSSPAVRLNIWCSAVTWTGDGKPETFRPFWVFLH